jgi:AraC-like DNA-binding protein
VAETLLHIFLGIHIVGYRGIFGPQVEIDHIALRSTSCGDAAHLSTLLPGISVRTGQEGDWVAVPKGLVDKPLPLANPWLREQLKPKMEAFLREQDDNRATTRAVYTAVEKGLERGRFLDLDGVAKELGVKPRTLRARLAAEGTTFKEVLDAVRKDCALREIASPGTKLASVAAQVGFSDSASFTRAFKRWTGTSPTEWQEQLTTRPPAAQEGAGATPAGRSHVASTVDRAYPTSPTRKS